MRREAEDFRLRQGLGLEAVGCRLLGRSPSGS